MDIHRDIHSKNIMYKRLNTSYRWYIIDYGLIHHASYQKNIDDTHVGVPNDLLIFIITSVYMNIYEIPRINKLIVDHPVFLKNMKKKFKTLQLESFLPKTTNKYVIHDSMYIILYIKSYDDFVACLGDELIKPKYDKYKRHDVPYPELLLYMVKHCDDTNYNNILKKIKNL